MRDVRPEADPRRLLFGSVCAAMAIWVMLAGCSGGNRDRDPAEILAADAARNSASPAGPQLTPSLNIGDVEALVRLALKAPAEQFPPTAEVEPMETRKGHLAAWYVTLKPPHPKAITVTLDISVMRDFSERPVVLELELLRDDQPTGVTWRTMISRQFIPAGMEVPDGPRSFQADMLQGLTELPASVLAVVRAKAVLTPKGTDPAALDWEHFDMDSVPPEDRSVMYSNPVRVTFENGS